ncbi:MAG: hypothetical protein ABSC64_19395, partial [Candidatus Korobacteraceae bacterium]
SSSYPHLYLSSLFHLWMEITEGGSNFMNMDDFCIVGHSPENQRVTRLFSVNTDSAPLSVTRK